MGAASGIIAPQGLRRKGRNSSQIDEVRFRQGEGISGGARDNGRRFRDSAATYVRADILEEVKRRVHQGAKEIIFLGQNINTYGKGTSENLARAHGIFKEVRRPKAYFLH